MIINDKSLILQDEIFMSHFLVFTRNWYRNHRRTTSAWTIYAQKHINITSVNCLDKIKPEIYRSRSHNAIYHLPQKTVLCVEFVLHKQKNNRYSSCLSVHPLYMYISKFWSMTFALYQSHF